MRKIVKKAKFQKLKARTNIKTRKPKVRRNIDKKTLKFGKKEEE
jgi:hypothetical protein